MKKIILKPKAIMLTFLFFGILAILVEVTAVALAQVQSIASWKLSHYGSSNSRTYSGDINLLRIGLNYNDTCFQNNDPNNNYFIPYNTTNEWFSFYGAVSGGKVPNVSVVPCCTNSPAGIYTAADYFSQSACSVSYPGCSLGSYNYSTTVTTSLGDLCWAGKWRAVKCATMFQPDQICHGDPCVVGIDSSNWGTPDFCYGVYDSLLKTCVYTGRLSAPIYSGYTSYFGGTNHNYRYDPSPAQTSVSTWGSCQTNVVCGDSICSPEYGENCAYCPQDCGACVECSAFSGVLECSEAGCNWDDIHERCI